jgi:hypothetical protein
MGRHWRGSWRTRPPEIFGGVSEDPPEAPPGLRGQSPRSERSGPSPGDEHVGAAWSAICYFRLVR